MDCIVCHQDLPLSFFPSLLPLNSGYPLPHLPRRSAILPKKSNRSNSIDIHIRHHALPAPITMKITGWRRPSHLAPRYFQNRRKERPRTESFRHATDGTFSAAGRLCCHARIPVALPGRRPDLPGGGGVATAHCRRRRSVIKLGIIVSPCWG